MRRLGLFFMLLCMCTAAFAESQSHYLRDIHVGEGDVIDGDLMVYRGDLTLEGEVTGKVVVFFGNCVIAPSGRIGGDLAVIEGDLLLNNPGQVAGRISQKDFLSTSRGEATPFALGDRDQLADSTDTDSLEVEEEDTEFFVAFNRVAGLQLGLQLLPVDLEEKLPLLDVDGTVYWAFGTHRLEADVQLRRALLQKPLLTLGVSGHLLTESEDGWMLTNLENSLAGWLLHMDFYDHYESEGYQVTLNSKLWKKQLSLGCGWFAESFAPLDRSTQWSWNGSRDYGENLYSEQFGFEGGDAQGLRANILLNKIKYREYFRTGYVFAAEWERSLGDAESDEYEYERWMGSVHLHLPLDSYQVESMNARILMGNSWGAAIPEPYLYRLGGPDALPGYRPKSIDLVDDNFDGELDFQDSESNFSRYDLSAGAPGMVLGTLEYVLHGGALEEQMDVLWLLEDMDLILTTSAGRLFSGDLGDLKLGEFQNDFGFGIAGGYDDWRLILSRSTESGEADWRLLFRLKARF